jgi:hypothetical protein
MILQQGQTVYFTTLFCKEEKSGILQEQTSLGYKISGVWYANGDISIKNVLLDSKTNTNNNQLLFG